MPKIPNIKKPSSKKASSKKASAPIKARKPVSMPVSISRTQIIDLLSRPELPRIALILAFVIVAYFGVIQGKGHMDDKKSTVTQLEQVTKQNDSARADVEALRAQQKKQGSSGVSKTLAVSLPQRVDWDRQYEIIYGLAAASGASLLEFTPNEANVDASASYRAIPVNLKMRCNFATCLRFINGLQSLSRMSGDKIVTKGPVWAVDSLSTPPDNKTIDYSMTATLHVAGNALLTGAVPGEPGAEAPTTQTPETP